MKVELISNGTGTGSWKVWPGGRAEFSAKATWGGGDLHLEGKLPDGSTAYEINDTEFTEDGSTVLDLAPGEYRVVVATATAAYANLVRIP